MMFDLEKRSQTDLGYLACFPQDLVAGIDHILADMNQDRRWYDFPSFEYAMKSLL